MKKMRRFLLMLCLLTVISALPACGRTKAPERTEAPSAEAPAVTRPEPTAAFEETEPEEPDAMYGPVLDAYYTALDEGWGVEKYMEANLNYLPGVVGDPWKVGYCMEDLDGDGVPELLIGSVEGSYIYAMYTMKEGAPVLVLRGSERNTYQLVSDGAFFSRGSNGAACTGYNFYTFYDGQLHFQDALIFNADADPENPWFYAMDEDWDVSNDLPYGTGDAEAHIQMVESALVEIYYVPFAQYND